MTTQGTSPDPVPLDSESSRGATIELGDFDLDETSPVREGKVRKIEDTRARLAFALLGTLAVTIVFVLALLAAGRVNSDEVVRIFGVSLAPLVGLVGAVTGYYYGRSSRP